jgi:hypothetical protein
MRLTLRTEGILGTAGNTLHRSRSFALSPAAAVVVALAALAGCAEMQVIPTKLRTAVAGPPSLPEGAIVLQPLAPVRRDIYTRSYRLGETYSAKVGDTVVSIKNYAITERVGRATALKDFSEICKARWQRRRAPSLCEEPPMRAVRGTMGSVHQVAGAVTLADGQFFAVAMPQDVASQVYLLVDPTGRLRKGAYIAWREALEPGTTLGQVPLVEFASPYPLSSDEPLFSFESVEKFVYMGPGYLSFDLVFVGTRDTVRGELMNFSYREYGRESTNRPTFERLLRFPANDPVIEVEKLRIEVEPSGYNELRFRVIADGQPESRVTAP